MEGRLDCSPLEEGRGRGEEHWDREQMCREVEGRWHWGMVQGMVPTSQALCWLEDS